MKICPSTSTSNVVVRVSIRSLSGVRLADKLESGESITFDVKARMEEKERGSGRVNVAFALSVGTKPNLVKFEIEGIASLEGRDEEIRKMLETDPETRVPLVFHRVYQRIFVSMYLMATLIGVPPPPTNLLLSEQQSPVVQMDEAASGSTDIAPQPSEASVPQEGAAQPNQPAAAPYGESATQQPSGDEFTQETAPRVEQKPAGAQPQERADAGRGATG